MRKRILIISLAFVLVAAFSAPPSVVEAMRARGTAQATKFKVRIENIASSDGQTASPGDEEERSENHRSR